MSSANARPWPQAHLLVIFAIVAATYTAAQSYYNFNDDDGPDEVADCARQEDVASPEPDLFPLYPYIANAVSGLVPIVKKAFEARHTERSETGRPLEKEEKAQQFLRPMRVKAGQQLRHLRRRVEVSVKGTMRQAFPGIRPWLARMEETRKRTGWPSVEALCKTVLPLSF
jgi:hypothetical protein